MPKSFKHLREINDSSRFAGCTSGARADRALGGLPAVPVCPPPGAASATGGGCAPLSFSAGTSVRMSTR
eukprot:7685779-Pyramimonas_sp.AAC.1